MAKIMLVEDDNNLREIYEARLQAEGYTIVSARDGEEALVIAKAEKPDLILSDVMMPKISGFEMLDILRNTDELKGVKIIMLTALGQTDDQQRADRLGADRYLVKSQVTLEDIVKVTHELLGDQDSSPPAYTPSSTPPPAPTQPDTPPTPTIPIAGEPSETAESAINPSSDAQPAAKEADAVEAQIEDFVSGATQDASAPPDTSTAANDTTTASPPPTPPEPDEPEAPAPKVETETTGSVPIANKKVIKPIKDDSKKDISTLVALEEAKQAAAQGPPPPTVVVATNETGAKSEPLAEPQPDTPTPATTSTVTPTEEPPAHPAVVTPINGDKIDPNSIAL